MSRPDDTATGEQSPVASPTVSTAPPPSRMRRWWSAIPPHLGPARTSTVLLAVLFLAIGALYLTVRPDPVVPAGTGGTGQTTAPAATTSVPTTAEPTTTTAPETTSEVPTTTDTTTGSEPTATTTEETAPETTTESGFPTTTEPPGPSTVTPTTASPPGG